MKYNLELKQISSLAKVFTDRICSGTPISRKSCVRGQKFSYQIAYRYEMLEDVMFASHVRVEVDPALSVQLYRVDAVPCNMPYYSRKIPDSDYLIKTFDRMVPDVLVPLTEHATIGSRTETHWHSIWVDVRISDNCPAGNYAIKVKFIDEEGEPAGERVFRIKVYPYTLPDPKLLYVQWFHCDCIADVHRVPVFSEEHWHLIGEYMRLAADTGINVILTPIFTPPLDTAVGGERPTVQLVGVTKKGDDYSFDFTRLKRYIAIARECGIPNFEISHLFTQWGAEHAPKVIANVDGVEKRIFGWETDATGEEYSRFLTQMMPALIAFFAGEGISKEHLFFHVSDEPNKTHLESYYKASQLLKPLIEGCGQFDALSALEFYEQGLVQQPVVATTHIEPFLEAKVPNLWCYYCCGQEKDVSNRFMAMPSYRNRIIGVQMYKFDIVGFLQWGYNFYYTRLSLGVVDPYHDTDGGGWFPSGDSFSVYPYGDTAIPSLRQKVFAEALDDIRLLRLVEQKIGRDAVLAELDRLCGEPLTFKVYPRTEKFFRDLHKFIFDQL